MTARHLRSPVERARELVADVARQSGFRGAYLVGSSTRPFRDATSDLDIEAVLDDDALEATPVLARHTFAIDEGPPRRVLHEILLRSRSELATLRASRRDVDHRPFAHAAILHDPDGSLAPLLAELAMLPADVQAVRMRVHFLEHLYGSRRALKCLARGEQLGARLVLADALQGFVKLLFVLRGEWPSMKHWAARELVLAGVDRAVVETLAQAIAAPTPSLLTELVGVAAREMEAHDQTFHHDADAMRVWAFLTDEGRSAFADWAAR